MSRFTYDKFEQDGVLTLLDPVFTTIAVFSVLFCIAVFLLKPSAKLVLFVGSFTIIMTAQLFWLSGILIDELALSNSSKNLILFVVAAIAQVIAIIAGYLFESKMKNKVV